MTKILAKPFNWQAHIGKRVKYVGYPVEICGKVVGADEAARTFIVVWDDKPETLATFHYEQRGIGQVVPL